MGPSNDIHVSNPRLLPGGGGGGGFSRNIDRRISMRNRVSLRLFMNHEYLCLFGTAVEYLMRSLLPVSHEHVMSRWMRGEGGGGGGGGMCSAMM